MITGLRITLDGHLEPVTLDNTTTPALLHALYQTIGCDLVDVVPLDGGLTVYVDDEGVYRSTVNPLLSLAVARLGAQTPLFGVGVFLGHDPDTGETTSLTRDQARAVVNASLHAIAQLAVSGGDSE